MKRASICTRMGFLMCGEVTPVRKSLSTTGMIANEQFFSRVGSFMLKKVALHIESFLTTGMFTSKWIISRVNSKVSIQMVACNEHFPTKPAFELPEM